MNRIFKYLLIIAAAVCFLPGYSAGNASAAADLAKVASRIRGGGISCDFTVKAPQGKFSGSLKAAGDKFKLTTTSGPATWYDGTSMWTANPSTRETTLVTPTSAEVSEANPMVLLAGYESLYNVFYSRHKAPAGRKLILLNPKKSGTGIKAVQVKVNSSTSLPEEFVIRMEDNSVSTVTVRNLRTGLKLSDAEFRYPEKDFPGYTLVDLR